MMINAAVTLPPCLTRVGAVGFGGGGAHYCLGANLARTEIRILLQELLTRLPDIHVPEGVDAVRGAKVQAAATVAATTGIR